jgi:hypothetical protein
MPCIVLYTRLDPAAVSDTGDVPTGFHQGGGGHITLAVANGIGYGTWIDRDGPNTGRFDVMFIRPDGNSEIASSFTLSSGAIHGATAAAGKVFFAPADRIYWVAATGSAAAVEVHHVNDPATKKPRRTGAFAAHRDHVLFVTGSGEVGVGRSGDGIVRRAARPRDRKLHRSCGRGIEVVGRGDLVEPFEVREGQPTHVLFRQMGIPLCRPRSLSE